MSEAKKASYTNEFKFKVAIDAIRGHKTISELTVEYKVAKSLIHKWKQQLLNNGAQTFSSTAKSEIAEDRESQLYEQLGRQTAEINYLKKCVNRYQ